MANDDSNKKRIDIQALRGIAVVNVLLFHLNKNLWPNGYVGVDMFFVISGYLITMILSRSNSLTMRGILTFFGKRIKRILPAYYLSLTMLLLCGYLWLTVFDLHGMFEGWLWASTFSLNIYRLIEEHNYFSQLLTYDFVLHLWSLAVEIQFYLLAPFLMIIRKGTGRILFIPMIFLSLWLHLANEGALSFSFILSRLWQFFVGGISYELEQGSSNDQIEHVIKSGSEHAPSEEDTAYKMPTKLEFLSMITSLLCISMIVLPLLIYVPVNDKLCRIIVTISIGWILAGKSRWLTEAILCQWKPLIIFGDISYSLYLCHWPCILFIKYQRHRRSLSLIDGVDAILYSSYIALASYYLIEKYFIQSSLRNTLIFILILGGISGAVIIETINSPSLHISDSEIIGATANEMMTTLMPLVASSKARKSAIRQNSEMIRKKYPPPPAGMKILNDVESIELAKQKGLSGFDFRHVKGSGKAKVAIIGDSFASIAFHYILPGFTLDNIGHIKLIATDECHIIIGLPVASKSNCIERTELAINITLGFKPDIIFMHFRFMDPLTSKLVDIDNDDVFNKLQHTIDLLMESSTRRIVVTNDHACPKENNFINAMNAALSKGERTDHLNVPFKTFWRQKKFGYHRINGLYCPKCEYVFSHRWLCDTNVCKTYDPQTSVAYYQENCHFSRHGIEHLTQYYTNLIEEMRARKYIPT